MYRKRGQASFEFLSTYIWVLMVVVVAVGAMAYFNVFDFQKYLPSGCAFGQNVVCEDWTLKSNNDIFYLDVKLRNNLEKTIEPYNITVLDDYKQQLTCSNQRVYCPYNGNSTSYWSSTGTGQFTETNTPNDWTIGSSCRLSLTCNKQLVKGTKTNIFVSFSFRRKTATNDAPAHTINGRVFTKVG